MRMLCAERSILVFIVENWVINKAKCVCVHVCVCVNRPAVTWAVS